MMELPRCACGSHWTLNASGEPIMYFHKEDCPDWEEFSLRLQLEKATPGLAAARNLR